MRNINFLETFQTLGDVHNSFKIILGTSKKVLKFYKFSRIVFRMSHDHMGSHGEHMASKCSKLIQDYFGNFKESFKVFEKVLKS